MANYADTRWPWRVTITKADGTSTSENYSDDFDPIGFAQHVSENNDVTRVDLATSFVAGEQVTPTTTEV